MNRKRLYSRRDFFGFVAGSLVLPAVDLVQPHRHRTSAGPTIQSIRVVPVPGEFYRFIGMNAYDTAPKGKSGSIRVVQVTLSDGTTGIGVEGYSRIDATTREGLQRLIGVEPLDVYRWESERIAGFTAEHAPFFENPRFAFVEAPILDAVGKLKETPVYALFGPAVREGVDCYDGTLYFADIANDTDASILGELARRIKDDGYFAIKQKVGRPGKWMKGEAGVERDIEAVAAVREAVGSNFNLMVDANDGYRDNFDGAVRFLEGCDPYELYWVEEIFPEEIGSYERLVATMRDRGITIRIAEGEGVQDFELFRPFLEAGIYEIVQPDMRTMGLTNILRGAALAESYGASLVPHNWQSEMGKIMSIHAAKIRPNITFAEDDRFRNFALDSSDYLFRGGSWYAPDKPGWGIELVDGFDRLIGGAESIIIS